jgi:hypothetical protein
MFGLADNETAASYREAAGWADGRTGTGSRTQHRPLPLHFWVKILYEHGEIPYWEPNVDIVVKKTNIRTPIRRELLWYWGGSCSLPPPPCCGTVTFFYSSGSETSSGSGSVSKPLNAVSKNFGKHLVFYIVRFFTSKKIYKIHLICCKCEWKNVKMKDFKYTILYCVCEITVSIPLRSVIKLRFRFRFRYGKKLRFLRFRFRLYFTLLLGYLLQKNIIIWSCAIPEN